MSRTVWVTVTILVETDEAYLVDSGVGENAWVPKSQIEDYSEESFESGDTIEVEIPEWLAIEKDMI